MSTPRAIRPLFGVGSRLIVDPFFSRPTRAAAKALFSGAAPTTWTQPPTLNSICWSCLHKYATRPQQIRFSSSSSTKSPSTGRGESTSSSPSPSHSTAADAYSQVASFPDIQEPKKEKETEKIKDSENEQSSPSTSRLDLPSALNSQRSALNQSLSSFMDRAQTTLFTASQRINHLTGYSSIESLKNQISNLESELRAAQTNLTDARSAYKSAVSNRSSTQREVTTLLARQKTWTPIDFERFTTLYRQDYELEASVGERAIELEQAEYNAERLGRELSASILARYHEEQIWSDKIRRMSTWGTWGLMGVNILLFLLLQFGAEPWRRRRLVRGFEEKVREAIAEERIVREEAERVAAANAAANAAALAANAEVEAKASDAQEESAVLEASDPVVPEIDAVPPVPTFSELYQNNWSWKLWRLVLVDLASDRKIALRMRDLSTIAVEGMAVGAVMAGTLAILFLRPS
ncbi:Mdm33 family-domain-containing protein [Xylaria nigripes]|nr:Mdm33 family-domain-containing protein [Xylaria nigripes]